jgi:hypothetical protein
MIGVGIVTIQHSFLIGLIAQKRGDNKECCLHRSQATQPFDKPVCLLRLRASSKAYPRWPQLAFLGFCSLPDRVDHHS